MKRMPKKHLEDLQSILELLQQSQDNANEALDIINDECDCKISDVKECVEFIENATNELGFAIERLECLISKTEDELFKSSDNE